MEERLKGEKKIYHLVAVQASRHKWGHLGPSWWAHLPAERRYINENRQIQQRNLLDMAQKHEKEYVTVVIH